MKAEESELIRAYNIALSDIDYYKDSIEAHKKNLQYARERLEQSKRLLNKCFKKAEEYNIKLGNFKEEKC